MQQILFFLLSNINALLEPPRLFIFRENSNLQRVSTLHGVWDLEKAALRKICVSGTVGGPLLTRKSPTCTYISQKTMHCNPLQGSTGFLQGNPCVVILSLHALAVYRVWRVRFHWNTGKYMHFVQELAFYIHIYVCVFITGISLLLEKQQHGILQKQGKPCK
jgi:hypothetical protein